MIRKILIFNMLMLFLSITLFSAEIDNSLILAGIKKYNSLLTEIKKSHKSNEEKKLETALVYKLINIYSSKKEQIENFKIPSNENEFLKLFDKFIENSLIQSMLTEYVKQTDEKISIFKEQILRENDNSSSLLTLQLQYAFYVKSNKIYKTKLNNKIKELSSIKEKLKTSLKKINIKEETALKNIETIKSRLNSLKLNIKKLQIEKERLLVLNKKAQLANIIKIIGNKNKNLQKITKELLKNYFLLFSSALKTGSRKKTFKIEKIITELLQKGKFNSTVTKNVSSLLKDMEKEYLGQLGTLVGSTQRGLSYIFKEIWDKLTYPLFNINKTPISILKIIIAIILIIVGFVSGSFYKKTIKTIAPKSKTLTDSTRTIIANLGYYNIILIVFLITLNVLGINLSSIAIIAGALSFGVGFGLQNIVSNFVSGIILMFERSIKIGDYIELGDELTGHVTDIRMRSTTITTNRNIDVIVPNQDLIQNKVINWTMNDRICRFEIPFGVKYGTSPEKVKEVILKAVNESGYTDIYFSRKPNVIMTEMGDSSVNFKLLVWIRGKNIFAPQITRSKYLMLIYNTLYENNIEIPYPQNDLHIRSIDEKVSFKITSE